MSLRTEVLNCRRCSLRGGCRAPVPPRGTMGPVCFVGEAPGADEDLAGVPFVGRSGQLIRRIIGEVTPIEQPYFANTVCCRPDQMNSDPPMWARAACRPFLLRALAGATVVVTLGAVALSAFSDRKVSVVRGRPFRWGPWCVMPSYHPAAALRNPELEPWIALDVACAWGLAHQVGEWPEREPVQMDLV